MNEIERIKRHLERAYDEVSKLKVSGDVVDIVYEIREEIRQAYRVASGMERETNAVRPPTSSVSASPSHLPRPAGKALEEDRDELPPWEVAPEDQEVSADAAAENEV